MCLYPSIIENPRYAKSNENSKGVKDRRLRWIQIPCGHCEECRRTKANEWRVRLIEEIKSNSKNIIFATLTFSEESLKKLEYDEKEPNKAPQKAISLFRKRWWKKYKKPLKHWLITELGHDNTKRIHLHGLIWTELTEEQFEKEWGYGWVFFGYNISERTINYIVKYVTKRDEANPEFDGKIFTSKKIGASYINKNTLRRHRYQDKFTEETYKTESGIKIALPIYYKQKIWTDQEREALRIIKEEKQTKYYNKTPIKVETIEQYREYVNAVKYWQSIKKYDGKRKEGNMQRLCRPTDKKTTTNSRTMENRIWNQEDRRDINTKQNTATTRGRGYIGDRSSSLIKLIGADRISQRNFKYEGTCYITEDGELYDRKQAIAQKARRTGESIYEVIDWEYNKKKKLYQPIIRRIVMIKITNTQLSLNL